MVTDDSKDVNSLERAIREAVNAESTPPGPDCPGLEEMLDAAEAVDAGREPAALEHIATCACCRREYVALRAAFAEADALRGIQAAGERIVPARPARRGLLAALGAWASRPFQPSALRLGLAGAAAMAAAVLGYVIGTRSVPVPPVVPVASNTAPDLLARWDRLNAELSSTRTENQRLKRLAAERSAAAVPPLGGPKASATREPPATRVAGAPPQGDAGRGSGKGDENINPSQPVITPGKRTVEQRAWKILPPFVRSVANLGRPLVSITAPSGLIPRDGSTSIVLSPAGTWVLSDRPVFRVRVPGSDADTRYILRVQVPSGEALSVEKVGESLEWQPAVRLPRGETITWTASARVGATDYAATGRFGVLTENQVEQVERHPSRVKGFERAQMYRTTGLLEEAAAVLEEEISTGGDRSPERRVLVEIREAMLPQVTWSEPESAGPEVTELETSR